ncbi:MAG: DUF922 domain-containing protein [Sulfuricella sp.]|nr:DUF922 domain-containing protein [Sulfuricella sp.]
MDIHLPLCPTPLSAAARCLLLLSVALPVGAGEIYKWRDADGRIHYQDTPPPEGAAAKPVNLPDTPSRKWANVDIQIEPPTIRRYEVRGFTLNQLSEFVAKNSPLLDEQGKAWGGRCRWDITWKFRYDQSPQRCAIASFSLRLANVIYMPGWVNRSAAPKEVQTTWDRYERALRRHEDGHRDNGVAATYEMANRVRAIIPQADCDSLNREIALVGARVTEEYRARDKKFDADTDHGRTQGVKF